MDTITAEPRANGSTTTLEAESESPVDPTANTAPEHDTLDTGNPSAEAGADEAAAAAASDESEKWPGWPGYCVFRLIVPVAKVGSIIGRKGELIKKMCEETRARIRVLDGPVTTPDRVVLISGKEELHAPLSPAMVAAIKVFRRVSGFPENAIDSNSVGVALCSIRLLVASTQAINLIGRQGSIIKSIQENSGASVRVLSEEETPFYATADERIVELQGEGFKVLKALGAVVGHLRKFLVDQSVLPLFEKNYNTTISQDRQVERSGENLSLLAASQRSVDTEYPLLARRDSLFLERETRLDPYIQPSGISRYGQDPAVSATRSPVRGRIGAPIVTQVAQTLQIPFSYAEDIIGIEGANIAYIRRSSGATITVQESRHPDEITVEIKGTSTQVQMAQQLIQDFMNNHKEPVMSSYGRIDTGYRPPSYSDKDLLTSNYGRIETPYRPSYSSSSLTGQPYGSSYGSPGVGGYGNFKL